MSAMVVKVKNCLNCREELAENGNGGTQCPKCQKNEAKYGKATTCLYCQLNAAFRDRKCVWCAHSERKFGDPVQCAHCSLMCAFPKSERSRKAQQPILCRLCIMQARLTKQDTLAGVKIPDEKKENRDEKAKSSSQRSGSHKRKHAESSANAEPPTARRPTGVFDVVGADSLAERESQLKIQKLNDEISRLTSVIQTKDTQLLEKDKMINSLKAENYNQEKKHRERVQQMQKEKEESIRMIENMRTKTKKT